MELANIYIFLAAGLGLFMAWGIGANDVANSMATTVGSRSLTIRQALAIAALFEFAGAVLAGGIVTNTVRGGIIDTAELAGAEQTLIFGMLAALAASGAWLWIASWRGWPVSTTHSIIGALLGFAIAALDWGAISWPTLGQVVVSWVSSPLLAGLASFALFRSVQLLVLERRDPLEAAKRWIPYYIFLTGFLVSLITLLRGLHYIGMQLSLWEGSALSVAIGLAMAVLGKAIIRRLKLKGDSQHSKPPADAGHVRGGRGRESFPGGFLTPSMAPQTSTTKDSRHQSAVFTGSLKEGTLRRHQYQNVERVFAVLMLITACALAFAHGSNDVANAIGPVAAVVATATGSGIEMQAPVPLWLLIMGALGMVAGILMLGRRVIATVGRNITQLTPSRGFACNLATAGTVVTASGAGIPISTTHTLVGAVLGVGLARGLAAIDLRVVTTVLMSWLITLPAGALLAIGFFYLFSLTLG